MIWHIQLEIGNINKELLNPISYFNYYFGLNLGELLFASIIGIATFLIASIFFNIILPQNILQLLLCLFIIILGIPITFFLQMIVGTLGFYTNTIWGLQILRKGIIHIFSGIIAPIYLFPKWFQNISEILPFQELIYTPINIWLGTASDINIAFIIFKQILWGVILYIIAKLFFEHAIKNLSINGG